MLILESLLPIFILVMLGYVLKKYRLTTESYLQVSDRLVYYIFFPTMLFWKIGGAAQGDTVALRLLLVAAGVSMGVALLSVLVILLFRISAFKAGSFSQSCYRFNTYIGVAVILNSFGETGVAVFGVMIALVIPMINVFAVLTLILFSRTQLGGRARIFQIVRSILGNPLIIGCVCGLIYARLFNRFPVFIDNSLQMMSMVTLPLALLSIGGSLSFRGIRENLLLSLVASTLKLCVLPLVGYVIMVTVGVSGLAFKVGLVFFCLPTSTAIYVLSSQMDSDTELASSAIMISTILSIIPLSFVLWFIS